METIRTPPSVTEQVKQYLETKFKLLKYEGIDKASAIVAELITDVVVALLLLITFIFFSITLALFAAYLLHAAWEGFGCVTLLYMIIALSVHLLKIPLQNIFIRKFIEKVFRKRGMKALSPETTKNLNI